MTHPPTKDKQETTGKVVTDAPNVATSEAAPPVASISTVPPFVPRVFLSHSSKDKAFGEQLVADLRAALGGSDAVWYDAAPDPELDDRGGLAVGDPFPAEIVHQLATRNVFAVVLSPDAVRSGWVDFEIILALDRYLSPSRDVAVILPVMSRPTPYRRHFASFSSWTWFDPNYTLKGSP